MRNPWFYPWVRTVLWRREWRPTPVFLPRECHGQRSLAGYSPWGRKESDMTEATEHTLPSWGLSAIPTLSSRFPSSPTIFSHSKLSPCDLMKWTDSWMASKHQQETWPRPWPQGPHCPCLWLDLGIACNLVWPVRHAYIYSAIHSMNIYWAPTWQTRKVIVVNKTECLCPQKS